MAKDGPSSSVSPFQRFETLAKALFAVPKKGVNQAAEVRRERTKRRLSKKKA
jgi:hypothetical protein